ncbi:LytR/AlgR family response regulator transcription factor [Reichenbachiella agariperforans]|uniref:LytR/AlgR family response regulator transcription factor n=1 Tax=Reichenbachiella agariperforans TaxID=156994 RepID=UPI001C08D5F9|nr:response regulator [Reichenbachiella agariperforans]MBU2914578.1 response regulator [Reichenbachiella agariperforans]
MKTEKILIVEDDALIAETLEVIVKGMGLECIGKSDNIVDALHKISNLQPDLILLDINLDGKQEGLELAEILHKREKTPCIFVTAYSDDKIVARTANTEPFGYLIKPFTQAEVEVAIKLTLAAIDRSKNQMRTVFDCNGIIYVKQTNGYHKIDINEIQYIEADNIYSVVVTKSQRCVISKPLKQLENTLMLHGFIRIHRSYLVNKKSVDRIRDGEVIINNRTLPIGRSFKDNLMSQINVI